VPYTIETHRHTYAAWAASRASSAATTCRFEVKVGKELLEGIGFGNKIVSADNLPSPQTVDKVHKKWREDICKASKKKKNKKGSTPKFTHGIAAKLINMYVKSVFVCGPHFDHDRVKAFHPPIDSLLLEELARNDPDLQRRKIWTAYKWTKMTSPQYEEVIGAVKDMMGDCPLWEIEEYWPGNR